MAWRADLRSMEYDDEDMLDRMTAEYEPPSYPPNLRFTLDCADLTKAAGEAGKVGETMRFTAMGEVTSVHLADEGCRIEVELKSFGGEDGKLSDLKSEGEYPLRPCICFCDYELRRLDLDTACELGDAIHLFGEAQLVSVSKNEFTGETACLQITSLNFEDESAEAREG